MKRKKIFILVCLAAFLLIPIFSWGQETSKNVQQISYSKGDQNFILNGGLFLPLFFLSLDGTVSPALQKAYPGVTGSLSWVSFLDNRLYLGFEFGGTYSGTLNRTFFMIPVMGKFGYVYTTYPFEIPLSVGAGVDFIKLEDLFTTTAVLKPEAGFYWNWSSEWAFGLNVAYWFVPELYFSDGLSDQSMFGNFLDIRLSAMYHF